GTADDPRHGRKPEQPFDHYLRHNLVFDCGGFFGSIEAVRTALIEIPASRIVFGTDYPQEIRSAAVSRAFVSGLRALSEGEAILVANAALLLNDRLSNRLPRR
ncbi:MAG TPA: hypothetical protein VNJ05_01450, partial [Sphingomicrobium sp.]|nr:hypothetical protein [Sphingomicrobium sp.]